MGTISNPGIPADAGWLRTSARPGDTNEQGFTSSDTKSDTFLDEALAS
jgi:hypothetical protein